MDRKDAFEQANAFVDGELDRDGRNEVLDRAAKDPRAAQELADLSRLKSTLEDSIDVPDLALASAADRARSRKRARRALALAACLALAFLTGAAWWWGSAPPPADGLPVAWVVKAHESWREVPSGRTLLRPAGHKLDAHVPDLAAAKLRIAHVGEFTAPAGAPALVVGYKGTRGCRVTLIVDDAPRGLKSAPVFVQTEGLQAVIWRAGPLRHQILAQGMDTARFRKIAETVWRSSLDRLPLNEETRMALARSRAESAPCAA
jgi:anti-sigma factor RsiW